MTTGERMKQLRKEKDVPIELIAEAMGVSVASVYRYESGDIEKVPGNMLEPLAKVLKTTPGYLMGWEEAENEFANWDEPTFGLATGNINLDEEIKALIGRINTAKKVKFNGIETNESIKSMAENTLDSLYKNIELMLR